MQNIENETDLSEEYEDTDSFEDLSPDDVLRLEALAHLNQIRKEHYIECKACGSPIPKDFIDIDICPECLNLDCSSLLNAIS